MTLAELCAQHPDLFYPQSWYADEAFMHTPLPHDAPVRIPTELRGAGCVPLVDVDSRYCQRAGTLLYPAVVLASLYVRRPQASIWKKYLWTSDRDHAGQRVYVGGTRHGHGLEIHRHLSIGSEWGVPAWP